MNNCRIKVSNEAESKEVQKLFFELDCKWVSSGQYYTDVSIYPSYIFCINSIMTHGTQPYYEHHLLETQEITLVELREILQEKQMASYNIEQQSQEVKYNEWLNEETFEVKPLPEYAAVKISEWVKIPDDAEFAVAKNNFIEFRKGTSYYHEDSGTWVKASWCFTDFPKCGWEVIWKRKTTEDVVKEALAESLGEIWKECVNMPKTEQQMQGVTFTQLIEDRTNIFNKLLQGVKFQYRYNDAGQWHNLTDKSISHLMKPNVTIREKPQKPVIDGIEMDKEAAIKYIQKHY